MRRIDDESVNGVPYEAIEDYREIQEPYWTCVFPCDVVYTEPIQQELKDNKLLTKKLYKLCVD